MSLTEAEGKVLLLLMGKVDAPRHGGVGYVGIGTPEDRFVEELEALGVVSRHEIPKQNLVRVTGAWVGK